jgi:ABC-2 type transport system ATP-binding protein
MRRAPGGGSVGSASEGTGRTVAGRGALSRESNVHGIDIAPRPEQPPTTAAPAIEVVGLERRYGEFHAVRGISFEVHPGEVFALLGVNGAGKTSALEVLEGLAAPSGGSVRILGHDPRRDRAAVRRHLGVLLQHSGLPADLTVRETVQTWARTLTDPRPVGEALEQVALSGRAAVRVRSLSGGERRRLDLALALLGRPRVVVLDEPTTGLDPESRRAVWGIVGQLVDGGAAVVLTTHHLEEAEELADRLAILKAGVVVLAGTPEEISATQPATIRFTLPEGAPPLPRLPGARVEHPAPQVQLSTFALQPALAGLLTWAGEYDLALTDLQTRAASLEQAFLAVADGAIPPQPDQPTLEGSLAR